MGGGKGKEPPAPDAKEGSSKRRPSNLRWTDEQNEALRGAVEKYGKKKKVDWDAVASTLKGKDADTCEMHWTLHLSGPKRQHWSPEADKTLLELVAGGEKWDEIAKKFPGRDVKQCRARYDNYLDPSLKKEKNWLPDERIKLRTHMEAGGKISVIAESLNRPQAAVKQQWYKMRDGREVDEDAATGSGLNRGELMSSDAGQEKVSRKDASLQGNVEQTPAKEVQERRPHRRKSNPVQGLPFEERLSKEDSEPKMATKGRSKAQEPKC